MVNRCRLSTTQSSAILWVILWRVNFDHPNSIRNFYLLCRRSTRVESLLVTGWNLSPIGRMCGTWFLVALMSREQIQPENPFIASAVFYIICVSPHFTKCFMCARQKSTSAMTREEADFKLSWHDTAVAMCEAWGKQPAVRLSRNSCMRFVAASRISWFVSAPFSKAWRSSTTFYV